MGEKPDGLDVFHPDRVASRILDMGDVLSLVEQVEQQVDKDKAQKLAEKVAKGKKFDLNDMRDQLEQMQNMGGIGGLMDKLPGMGQIPDSVKNQVTGKEVPRMVAIIDSMTKKERRNPDLLNGSRRARIAKGSGTDAGRRQQAAEAVPADGKDDVQAVRRRHEGPDARHEGHDGRARRDAFPGRLSGSDRLATGPRIGVSPTPDQSAYTSPAPRGFPTRA